MTCAGESGVARARLVARVAAALANHSPEAVVHDLPEAVQLAELVLNCLSLGKSFNKSCKWLHHRSFNGRSS